MAKLDCTRQYPGKNLDLYIKRFHEKEFYCSDPVDKEVLVNACLHHMDNYRVFPEISHSPLFPNRWKHRDGRNSPLEGLQHQVELSLHKAFLDKKASLSSREGRGDRTLESERENILSGSNMRKQKEKIASKERIEQRALDNEGKAPIVQK